MSKTIALIGARGHVGEELIRLIEQHPRFTLGVVSSREREGQRVADHVAGFAGDLVYRNVATERLGEESADAFVLALPNGKAAEYVAAIESRGSDAVILDLSADYRFDDGWYYGLPELTRTQYRGERRISNPGCYATAMQLAIAPMRAHLSGAAQCFGVSGYSGAGTAPSDRNDPEKLRDNLMPYALVGHLHEREVSRHCAPVEFMPHVASHFRGLSVTANLHLDRAFSHDDIVAIYRTQYAGEPLVEVRNAAPWVRAIANRHGVHIGGFTLAEDGHRLVVVSVLDNLLKGAATQAMQNLNRAFGFDEFLGLRPEAGA